MRGPRRVFAGSWVRGGSAVAGNPKDNPIQKLLRASDDEIEAEIYSRADGALTSNINSGGSWGDQTIVQMLNNELTGRYMKRTTTLALWIAKASLAVSFVALVVTLWSIIDR